MSPLPIELITSDAVKNDRQVEFSLKAASETSNDYFTIDRSAAGISGGLFRLLMVLVILQM